MPEKNAPNTTRLSHGLEYPDRQSFLQAIKTLDQLYNESRLRYPLTGRRGTPVTLLTEAAYQRTVPMLSRQGIPFSEANVGEYY